MLENVLLDLLQAKENVIFVGATFNLTSQSYLLCPCWIGTVTHEGMNNIKIITLCFNTA
jgi:hypothetical protein